MYAFPIIKDLLVKEKFYVLFSKKKEKKRKKERKEEEILYPQQILSGRLL